MPAVWTADAVNTLQEAIEDFPNEPYECLRSFSSLFKNLHNSSEWYVASTCTEIYRPTTRYFTDLYVSVNGTKENVITIFNI